MGKATYNLKIGTVRMLQNKAVNFLGSYSVSKKKRGPYSTSMYI